MDQQPNQHLHGDSVTQGVTIPRWIEVKDHRKDAENLNPQRATYYVVSPECSLEDAKAFGQTFYQRERMERTYQFLERIQPFFLILTVVAVLWIVLGNLSYLFLLVPALLFAGYQAILQDALNVTLRPFDVKELQAKAKSTLVYRIHVSDYQRVLRFATSHPDRAQEAHRLMWRIHTMQELYATSEREMGALKKAGRLSPDQVSQARSRLGALHNLILESQSSLRTLLSPPRVPHPLERERILDLIHEINTVLRQGVEDLVPRLEGEVQGDLDRASDQDRAEPAPTDKEPGQGPELPGTSGIA